MSPSSGCLHVTKKRSASQKLSIIECLPKQLSLQKKQFERFNSPRTTFLTRLLSNSPLRSVWQPVSHFCVSSSLLITNNLSKQQHSGLNQLQPRLHSKNLEIKIVAEVDDRGAFLFLQQIISLKTFVTFYWLFKQIKFSFNRFICQPGLRVLW